jgi:hypothetical protein
MRTASVLLSLALLSLAYGESKQTEVADVPWGKQPDHLVPLVPETGIAGQYRDLMFKHLCITAAQFGRMALEIGFDEPEWVVSVYGEDEVGINTTDYKSYHITVTKAHDSIWTSLPPNNGEHQQKPIEVSRQDVVVDRQLVVAVQRAWTAMLLQTRYAERTSMFTDAPTVWFSVECRNLFTDLYGAITPPTHGLTKEMFDIGVALRKFCELPPEQRPAEREKLISRLKAFERKARKV